MSTASKPRADQGSTKYSVARGTLTFAGVMLVTVGSFQILEGIAAIAEDTVFVNGINYVYEFDVTTWGWIHLVVGVIGVATGLGILAGQTWGLFLGVVIAFLGALSNFAFMPYYPFWSFAVLAFYVFVIWALTTELTRD